MDAVTATTWCCSVSRFASSLATLTPRLCAFCRISAAASTSLGSARAFAPGGRHASDGLSPWGLPRWRQRHTQQGPRQSAGGLSRPLRACDSLWACIPGEVNGLLPCTRCRGWLGSEADPSLPRQCFGTHLPCGRCLPPRLVPVLSPLAWPYPWMTPNGPRLAWRMGWSSFCPARELE